jgi:hypothetical protein
MYFILNFVEGAYAARLMFFVYRRDASHNLN